MMRKKQSDIEVYMILILRNNLSFHTYSIYTYLVQNNTYTANFDILGVISQVDAQSESPLTIDVTDGQDATLECRFSPQLSKKASTLFWIRTNRRKSDNVAIGNTPYETGYR